MPKNLLENNSNNIVEIEFNSEYSKDGCGLGKFEGDLEKDVYIFTHGEPNHISKIFPCFD